MHVSMYMWLVSARLVHMWPGNEATRLETANQDQYGCLMTSIAIISSPSVPSIATSIIMVTFTTRAYGCHAEDTCLYHVGSKAFGMLLHKSE